MRFQGFGRAWLGSSLISCLAGSFHWKSQISDGASEAENKPPASVPAPEPKEAAPACPQEETEETWEEKEDKLDPEKVKAADQKYQYKEGEPSFSQSRCPAHCFLLALGLARPPVMTSAMSHRVWATDAL